MACFTSVIQVFFAEDRDNPQWNVVIQKEARSRRVEDDADQYVIGAGGLESPLTFEDPDPAETARNLREGNSGENVRVQEVAAVDATREAQYTAEPLEAMDHVDDDDDDDVEDDSVLPDDDDEATATMVYLQ